MLKEQDINIHRINAVAKPGDDCMLMQGNYVQLLHAKGLSVVIDILVYVRSSNIGPMKILLEIFN